MPVFQSQLDGYPAKETQEMWTFPTMTNPVHQDTFDAGKGYSQRRERGTVTDGSCVKIQHALSVGTLQKTMRKILSQDP